MTSSPWCVVVNPHAGARGVSRADVVDAFTSAGIQAAVFVTDSPGHLTSTVTRHIAEGMRRFVVVGGDGTAHIAVNAMMKAGGIDTDRLALGVIAAGSGSDFVRTFGHKKGLASGVQRLVEPDMYPVDVGLVSGGFGQRYFLNALNVGVAAASARRAGTLPRSMGSFRYVAGFWLALASFREGNTSVGIDRHAYRDSAINVVVANGQFFGGGMNIAPRASLKDGLFDVQVFSGPRRKAFSVMPRVMRGTHLSHTAVRRYVGSQVDIDVPPDWPVEADGEMLGSGGVSVSMLPAAIDFVA